MRHKDKLEGLSGANDGRCNHAEDPPQLHEAGKSHDLKVKSNRADDAIINEAQGTLPALLPGHAQDSFRRTGHQILLGSLPPEEAVGSCSETFPYALVIKKEPVFDNCDLQDGFWNDSPVAHQGVLCACSSHPKSCTCALKQEDDATYSPEGNTKFEDHEPIQNTSNILMVDCGVANGNDDYIIKVSLEDPVSETNNLVSMATNRDTLKKELETSHMTNNGSMVTKGEVTVCHIERPGWIPDLHCNSSCHCRTYERFRRKPRRQSKKTLQLEQSSGSSECSDEIIEDFNQCTKEPKKHKNRSSPCKRKGPKQKRRRVRELISSSDDPERSLSCTLCTKTFKCLRTCENHVKLVHKIYNTGDKIFSCSECDKEFPKQGLLAKHMTLHTGEKAFTCAICGDKFSQKVHLKRHLLVHSEKEFKCDECGKTFRLLQHLRRHINMHRGTLPYKCHLCPRTCADSSSLRLHLNAHNDRPFTCPVCYTLTKSEKYLKDHMKTHHI